MEKNFKQELIDKLQNIDDNASDSEIKEFIAKYIEGGVVWKAKIGRPFFASAILLAVLTITVISITKNQILDIVLYSAWTIIPPSWFLLEYTWHFPDNFKLNSSQLDDLKYTQELAGKIWQAVVLLITAIVYLKYQHNIFS